MNSSIIKISDVLNNAKSFNSAGFSTGYSFDSTNAEDYFDELLENSLSSGPIFSGILILEKSGNDFTIIDGLQRITTISLLLCALCESYKNTSKNNEEAKEKIFERFLVCDKTPKLKLKGIEQDIYNKILYSLNPDKNESENNLAQAYQSFLNRIKSRKISGTKLFKIISKIQFMVIIIEKSEVSARDLYQTINSNKNNSQINLISDFIEQKNKAAGRAWQDCIQTFKSLNLQNFIISFIKNFLIIQNDGKVPGENALYNNFKSYFSQISRYQDTETIISNMCQYSKYYLKIINADFENDEIKAQIKNLNENKGEDTHPYLMEVLDDLENSHITQDVFLEILKMINSFIEKRNEGAASNVNFALLSKEINKMLIFNDFQNEDLSENKWTINKLSNLTTFEV